MYKANSHKELKKQIKGNKFPIHIVDGNTIKVVETMEELKKKGVDVTVRDKNCAKTFKTFSPVNCKISESTVVALAIISAVTLVALYALYKNKNIKVKYNPEGSVELYTSN
jgi:hypothetical protein